VIFVASKDENTLIAYKYKRNFKAKHGEAGKSKDQYGAHAEDLILVVPVGTMIRDCATDKVLHVMSVDKEQFVAVK
jgi:GTP-binding protein